MTSYRSDASEQIGLESERLFERRLYLIVLFDDEFCCCCLLVFAAANDDDDMIALSRGRVCFCVRASLARARFDDGCLVEQP